MPSTTSGDYDTRAALEENEPIYLAEIVFGATTLRFTTDNADIVFPTAGDTYTAWGFEFTPIRTSASNAIDRCRFKFDNTDLTFSTTYLSTYDFQSGTITLKRVFRDQLTNAADAITRFKGEIKAPQFDEHIAEFEAVSVLRKMREVVPKRQRSNMCPYPFDEVDTCRNSEMVNNGDMELDANWNDFGTPTQNARSDIEVFSGSFSRRFQVNAINEGIESDTVFRREQPAFNRFTIVGNTYAVSLQVYPDDSTRVRVRVTSGIDGTTLVYNQAHTSLTQDAWNLIEFEYIETGQGTNATIIIESDTEITGLWYVDDVSIREKLTREVSGTVDAGTTATAIVDAARTEIDDYWNEGVYEMTSGSQNGERRMVIDFDAGTDTATTKVAYSGAPSPGDTYTAIRGCNKSSRDCNVKHDNWINFGGFPSISEE